MTAEASEAQCTSTGWNQRG